METTELLRYNEKLEKLLRRAQEPPSMRPNIQQRATPGRLFWKFLHNLYDTMVRPLSCCGCPTYHQGRVDLVKSLQSSFSELSAPVDLDVFLSRKPLDGCEGTRWHDSTISINIDNENPRFRVTFNDDDSASRHRADSVIEPRSPDLPQEAVDNICELMEMACENKCSLRMLYDGDQLFQTRPQSKMTQHSGLGAGISLGALLRAKQYMSLKQKRVLAVILAHAMLQYHGSPWLSHEWSKDHVEFFYVQGTCVNVQRPYMSTSFLDPCPKAVPSDHALHPYPAVLALGIMLLEIHLGHDIESKRAPEDLSDGRVNANTDLFTAHRILEESCDEIFENYRSAIRACVDYTRFLDQDIDEDEFRQTLYCSIVKPLEDELKTGFFNGSEMQVVAEQMAACTM